MSTEIPSRSKQIQSRRTRPWLNGYAVFTAAALFVLGLWQLLAGSAALLRDALYAAPSGYLYAFDVAGWGWVELLLGVLAIGTAVVVLMGRVWGEPAAIVVASLSMLVNFLLIPYYAIWSLLIIALSVVVIWAVSAYERDVA
ncbi:MAG TPA: hypothetical protein VGE11_18100 [Pseudonocardia sp.]